MCEEVIRYIPIFIKNIFPLHSRHADGEKGVCKDKCLFWNLNEKRGFLHIRSSIVHTDVFLFKDILYQINHYFCNEIFDKIKHEETYLRFFKLQFIVLSLFAVQQQVTPVDYVRPQIDTHKSRWFFFSSASRPFGWSVWVRIHRRREVGIPVICIIRKRYAALVMCIVGSLQVFRWCYYRRNHRA